MEFFRFKRSIPFMRYALIFNVISLITFLIAVGALATKGLHLGVDFTGGTVIEVTYEKAPDLDPIRERMVKVGFSDPSVQNFGTARDVLIRLPVKEGITSAQLSERVMTELRQLDAAVKLQRVEFVGPQVGKELLENGALALTIGICFGIYSSVLVGSPLLMWLGLKREDLVKPEKPREAGEDGAIV